MTKRAVLRTTVIAIVLATMTFAQGNRGQQNRPQRDPRRPIEGRSIVADAIWNCRGEPPACGSCGRRHSRARRQCRGCRDRRERRNGVDGARHERHRR